MVFAPDGKSLFSAGPDKTIRRWDAVTAKELGRFNAPAAYSALAITRDGQYLITASPDSTVLVWSVKAMGLPKAPAKGQPKTTIFSN